jgi:hypothetical protein
LLVTNSCCGRALPANSKCMTPQLVAGLSPSRRAQSNRSCIGDRVWILPDWPRPCRTSANTASRPDTEFHGVRYGVPRSRHYRASRRNHSTAQWFCAKRQKLLLRVTPCFMLLRETPCRACLPYTQTGTLAASKRQMRLPWGRAPGLRFGHDSCDYGYELGWRVRRGASGL